MEVKPRTLNELLFHMSEQLEDMQNWMEKRGAQIDMLNDWHNKVSGGLVVIGSGLGLLVVTSLISYYVQFFQGR